MQMSFKIIQYFMKPKYLVTKIVHLIKLYIKNSIIFYASLKDMIFRPYPITDSIKIYSMTVLIDIDIITHTNKNIKFKIVREI